MTEQFIYNILSYLYVIPLVFGLMLGVSYIVVMGDYVIKRMGLIVLVVIFIAPFIPIFNIIWLKSLIFSKDN